jgi:hypothetical protein
MADFPNESAKPLADARWLNITRAMAAAPIVVALVHSLWPDTARRGGCSEDFSLLSIILWLATPPYVFSLVRLLGKSALSMKRGLAWAVVAGSFWGVISLLVLLPEVFGGSARDAGIPLLSTVIQITLVAVAIKTYYSTSREKGDAGVLFKRVPLFILYLIVFGSIGVALPDFYSSKQVNRAASALEALQEINSAQADYAGRYPQGFSTALADLGPPPAGAARSASAAGLIDRDLASGARHEYTLRYTPGAPDAAGKIMTYTLTAEPSQPECTRWKRFFTDQSSTIHETSENRPATVNDPAL